ncbi:putative aldose-1-epimerase [Thelonectria olida]|uniref:Aldose-1-epimerase n=1 Tax=Thelonectria olida TaxID=1576542 RepID=A0A9P9AR16_9HYPO|nr:putative aldose-1-epimerase [Thelonectria olida]
MTDSSFTFLPLGAIIQSIVVNGTNIVQGFPTADDYVKYNTPYFGETIGRWANRIKGAKINDLNGKSYDLVANNGPNHLHGGTVGWGKRVWEGPTPVGLREIPGIEGLEGGESVAFKLIDKDGEEGYPGTLEATIVYTTGTQKVDGKDAVVLGIDCEAKLVDGADETVVNLTNHSYFNLSGDATIEGTTVTLPTNQNLPFDEGSIPIGGPEPYAGIESNVPFTLGAQEPDVDNCFIVNEDPASVPIDTRNEPLKLNLAAHHPKSGIHLEVLSTEPAFQFYTGKYIDVPAVAGLPARGARSAFCCEPGRYVNAINEPEWKNMVVVKKGESYGSRFVYKAWAD